MNEMWSLMFYSELNVTHVHLYIFKSELNVGFLLEQKVFHDNYLFTCTCIYYVIMN